MSEELEPAIDMWIDAIPIDQPYSKCPCGCGEKWKFVVQNGHVEDHEKKYVENIERSRGNVVC